MFLMDWERPKSNQQSNSGKYSCSSLVLQTVRLMILIDYTKVMTILMFAIPLAR